MESGSVEIAIESYKKSRDLPSLFLIATTLEDKELLEVVADQSFADGRLNLAFYSYFKLGNKKKCVETLVEGGKLSEAMLFCQVYSLENLESVYPLWK